MIFPDYLVKRPKNPTPDRPIKHHVGITSLDTDKEGECIYCGVELYDNNSEQGTPRMLQWDHMPTPKRRGGVHVFPACEHCHGHKDSISLEGVPDIAERYEGLSQDPKVLIQVLGTISGHGEAHLPDTWSEWDRDTRIAWARLVYDIQDEISQRRKNPRGLLPRMMNVLFEPSSKECADVLMDLCRQYADNIPAAFEKHMADLQGEELFSITAAPGYAVGKLPRPLEMTGQFTSDFDDLMDEFIILKFAAFTEDGPLSYDDLAAAFVDAYMHGSPRGHQMAYWMNAATAVIRMEERGLVPRGYSLHPRPASVEWTLLDLFEKRPDLGKQHITEWLLWIFFSQYREATLVDACTALLTEYGWCDSEIVRSALESLVSRKRVLEDGAGYTGTLAPLDSELGAAA